MTVDTTGGYSEFLVETEEMLDRISINLALVEKEEHSGETLREIYRDMHTIKGGAQLFRSSQIAQVAHTMESVLDPVRNNVLPLSTSLLDAIYQGIDFVKFQVSCIRDTGSEGDSPEKIDEVTLKLINIVTQMAGGSFDLENDAKIQSSKPKPLSPNVDTATPLAIVPSLGGKDENELALMSTSDIATQNNESEMVMNEEKSMTTEPKKEEETRVPSSAANGSGAGSKPSSANDTIRVPVGLLDSLMNLVGELVLIRNQVLQYNDTSADAGFQNLSQRLSIVTTELQNEVMKTRMQPIGNILTKFQRVVREVSHKLGKKVNLVLEGTDTELDKTLIEAVKDPLAHIVRNAVDHGLEMPEDRLSSGKNEAGQISIRSYHEGGQVIVEVSDDGRGLSRDKIEKKAIEKGLVTQEQCSRLSDREIHNLIFSSGFSTVEKVSDLSGRGVGMDVVRTNIEKIGGMVDLTSEEGKGMAVRLKIPLTLAIVPALIVKSGKERFAIPQVKLVELVRVESGSPHGIQMLQDRPVFQLRGDLLPLVSLNETLGYGTASEDIDAQNMTGVVNIVVLNADNSLFGLIVDSIEDSIDIVVKPLSNFLKNLEVYAGATVMGDGSVSLTLDIAGLAGQLKLFGDVVESQELSKVKEEQSSENVTEAVEYLVIDVGATGKYAIPLCQVNRLEEFKIEDIEMSGAQRVVRYRDSILPIVSISKYLGIEEEEDKSAAEEKEKLSVIVVGKSNRLFGLEVKQILDVLSEKSEIDSTMRDRPGIIGTLLYDEGVLVVIDTYNIVGAVEKNFIKDPDSEDGKLSADKFGQNMHVLVVEDNNFYRKHVMNILSERGFSVDSEINGRKGFERLKEFPNRYSAVISDIEMPEMDGYQMVEKVRAELPLPNLPIIALTTKFKSSDLEYGFKMGFTDYLEKLKADELLGKLEHYLIHQKGA